MPAIHNHIRRHRPLITPRIQFQLAPRPPLPLITPRMEFDLESLACSSPTGSADSSSHSSSDPGSPIDLSRDMDDDEPELDTDRGSSTLPQSASTTPNAAPALIPKPNGEPGRPRSGGFNLEATLKDVHNWSTKDIDDLNVRFLLIPALSSLTTYLRLCRLSFATKQQRLSIRSCVSVLRKSNSLIKSVKRYSLFLLCPISSYLS